MDQHALNNASSGSKRTSGHRWSDTCEWEGQRGRKTRLPKARLSQNLGGLPFILYSRNGLDYLHRRHHRWEANHLQSHPKF